MAGSRLRGDRLLEADSLSVRLRQRLLTVLGVAATSAVAILAVIHALNSHRAQGPLSGYADVTQAFVVQVMRASANPMRRLALSTLQRLPPRVRARRKADARSG